MSEPKYKQFYSLKEGNLFSLNIFMRLSCCKSIDKLLLHFDTKPNTQ